MADLLGVDKVPQAEAGLTALREEFYRRVGVGEGTIRAQEVTFQSWVKGEGKIRDVEVKEGVAEKVAVREDVRFDLDSVKMVEKGIHIGKVLGIQDGVVVQDAGRGVLVGHKAEKMEKSEGNVKLGDVLEVVYSGGRALVTSRSDVANALPRMRGDGA